MKDEEEWSGEEKKEEWWGGWRREEEEEEEDGGEEHEGGLSAVATVYCNPLKNAACGHAHLHVPYSRPPFPGITRSMLGILEAGWFPATLMVDLLKWVSQRVDQFG